MKSKENDNFLMKKNPFILIVILIIIFLASATYALTGKALISTITKILGERGISILGQTRSSDQGQLLLVIVTGTNGTTATEEVLGLISGVTLGALRKDRKTLFAIVVSIKEVDQVWTAKVSELGVCFDSKMEDVERGRCIIGAWTLL